MAFFQRDTSQPLPMLMNVLPVLRLGPSSSLIQPLTMPPAAESEMVTWSMNAVAGRQLVMMMAASLSPGPQPKLPVPISPPACSMRTWLMTLPVAAPPDQMRPAQSPAAGATDVARSSDVTLTFASDVRDVNQQTVQLRAQGERLPAKVSYDGAARVAKVSPRGKLPDGTKVTVKVAGVRTADGRPVPATSWAFTTRDHTAPKVVKRTKGTVARKAVIRVKLSEHVVNAGKGAVKLRTVAGKRLKAEVRWVARTRTIVVDPVKTLPKKARIVVRVKAGLRDAAGNTMRAKSWRFTTRR